MDSPHSRRRLWYPAAAFGTLPSSPPWPFDPTLEPSPNIALKTLTLPKPLVEFANKPMILHQVQALAAAGVTDIVLAVNYRPEIMTAALKKV